MTIHEKLLEVAKVVLDEWYVPDSNCSCHIAAPCNDCVEYSSQRSVYEDLKSIVAAACAQVKDDAMPVDEEWLRSMGLQDNSISRDQRRYEIISGVRIVSNACVGGWEPFLLWAGTGECYEKKNVTRGDVRRLLAALGVNS